MTSVTVLPHPELCPEGLAFEVRPGKVLCDAMLAAGIGIEHACDGVCACSTCHVIVRQGFQSLGVADEEEEDRLDKAWGVTALSRLACQIKVARDPLVLELPRYSLNHARETE